LYLKNISEDARNCECKKKSKSIGYTLHRNSLQKHVIEGKIQGRIEMTGRRGRRGKQILDNLKKIKGYRKLEQEALDRSLRSIHFGIGHRPVVRDTAE
jgi:hypothetical protein